MTAHDELPRDPALARRYREAAEESGMAPPPALDARILAEARTAVQPPTATAQPFTRPWWRRLALPAGVMATTVLAVMLSLTVQRQAPETLESEGHERREQRASQAPATAGAIREAVPPTGPGPATERAAAAEVAPVAPSVLSDSAPRAVEKKAMPKPVVPAAPASPVTIPAPGTPLEAAAPATSNEAATVLPRGKMEAADRAREAEPIAPLRLQRAAPAAASPARQEAAKGDTAGAAQAWIEEIRELRRQGREEEAVRRLAEFRKAYPGYVLPEDLR